MIFAYRDLILWHHLYRLCAENNLDKLTFLKSLQIFSVCVGVLNQILSNCRLNLVRNLIICSLNLANFKFSCSNLIVLLSLAKALCLKLLVSFKFCFLYAWVRVFKLNFAYELARFDKENIALIILFTKALTTFGFIWWANLVRNLIICSLNLVKFKLSCPNLIVLLSLAWVTLLKFDQANAAY